MKDAVFSSILTVNFSLSNEKAGRAKGSPTGSSPTGSCNGVYAVTLQEKRARRNSRRGRGVYCFMAKLGL